MNHATLLQLSYLFETLPGDSIFAQAIRMSRNTSETVQMIKDQLKDNRVMVVDIVGERIITLIEKL